MFSPLTSTIITGEHDAVLVDPPMTIDQATRVGNWIAATGKNLTHIYFTPWARRPLVRHGDHWFGTAPLLRRFPLATALATPGTIAMMRMHASPEFRARPWDAQFPGQIPDSPVLAAPPAGNRFDLEGHELIAAEVGHTDTDDTTVLHVPSIGLVVAGDAVYNGVHQYLRESAGGGLEAWLQALDQVEKLQPKHVVSGHKHQARRRSPRQCGCFG